MSQYSVTDSVLGRTWMLCPSLKILWRKCYFSLLYKLWKPRSDSSCKTQKVQVNGSAWTQTQALCLYAMLILNGLNSFLNHLPDFASKGGKDLSNLTSEDMIVSHFLDLASWIVSGWQWLIALSLLPNTRAR